MRAPPEIARIEAGIGFQRRVWLAERIGWGLMAALVAAALLGSFGGGGPLARGTAREGGLEAAWPRIARLGSSDPMQVTVPAEPGAPLAELRLPRDLPERWRLREIAPTPVEAEADGSAFVLRLRRGADGTAAVTFQAEPVGAPGPRRLRLESGGRVLDLPVFVWP